MFEQKESEDGLSQKKQESIEEDSVSKKILKGTSEGISNIPWTKKYQPKSSGEIVGQDFQIKKIKDFVNNFKRQGKKSVILYGPSGIGKTASVYAIANENSWEVLEVNASDFRNSEHIQAIVGNAARQASLFAKQKILLVDEIDGLSGQEDRGGVAALAKIISETAFPIVMTAGFQEDPKEIRWDSKFKSIKNKSVLIKFQRVASEDILKILQRISKEEGLKIDEEILKKIARCSGGDVRAAITDLETIAQNEKIKEDAESKDAGIGLDDAKEFLESLGSRRLVEQMPRALLRIFKTLDPKIASTAFDSIDEDVDTQMLWIDENLPKEYKNPKDLARAYESLSKADVFRGRIKNWQYWGFLRTINLLITTGIAVAKDKRSEEINHYKQPERLLKIWKVNKQYQLRSSIAERYASKNHCSKKEAVLLIPHLRIIFRNDKRMAEAISKEIKLEEEEIEWLKNG